MLGAKTKILVLILLLVVGVAEAQDAAPWPPDPADVFAPGVEVVRVEVDKPFWDNVTRLVYEYDEEKNQWNSYPYPDQITEIDVMWDYGRSDHQLGVRLKGAYTADNAWLFDPVTGSFSLYPYLCKESVLGDLWAFFVAEGKEYTYLCNIEDGSLNSPLPTNAQFGLSAFGVRIVVSPNRRWVVFHGGDAANRSIHFYVYDTRAKQITELGSDNGIEQVKGVQWFDNNRIVITSGDVASWGSTNYYTADLTQSNSLTFFKSVANDYLMGLTGNPPHYEWLDDGCTLVKFFPATNKRKEYSLEQSFCTRGLLLNGKSDDRLYETVNYDENALPVTITLTRYNPSTGQHNDFFTGEIERVMKISPDGKYVVLVIDHNGIVDMKLDTDGNVYSEMNIEILPFPTLAVLDLETQKIVYEVDTTWHWTPDYWHYWFNPDTSTIKNTAIENRGGPLSNILGLGNNFLVRKYLPYECGDDCEDILITVSDERVIETSIAGSIEAYLPDSDQLLIRDNANRYLIYEIADGTTKPLFNESYRQTGYQVYIEGVVGGDSLSILLNSTIRYTIRIPQ